MPAIEQFAPGPPAQKSTKVDGLPHVLLMVDGMPKALGGGERIVLRLASLLPLYGFRVSILTFFIHPESSFKPADAPCPVYLLPIQRTYDLRAIRAAFALRAFLRDENVRLVQTFFESSDIWGGFVTRALSSAKLVWSRRDMGILRGRKHSSAYRLMRNVPDAVFAVSDQVARHAIEVDGVSPARVKTIYNGLDLDLFQRKPKGSRTGPMVITTIGNIRRVKGQDVLVKAAAQVLARHPNVVFTVAGEVLEQEYFDELRVLLRELGIEGSFRFLGKVTDLPAHLREAHIFVLPSRSEGFSNALIEAMASGVPVIATDVGGNAEAIGDPRSGLLVPAEDVPALASALNRLVESEDEANRMGEAGRARVQDHFTADAMMKRLTGAYAELLQTS